MPLIPTTSSGALGEVDDGGLMTTTGRGLCLEPGTFAQTIIPRLRVTFTGTLSP